MDLTSKVVVVTGGAQGLGLAIATHFAAKGAVLALVDLNSDRLTEAVTQCEKAGGKAHAYTCNVSKEDEVVSLFSQIVSDLGGIDGLINNAGITRDALFVKAKDGEILSKMSLKQWQQVIDVNLTGTFLCGREAACHMVQGKRNGVIINISSISRAGNRGQTNYSASKSGVVAMAVAWSKELARYGIRTGAIAPGFIATEMVMNMKPEARERAAAMIPAGRLGEPAEIAQTAAYIFENDYFNGRCIELDGGLRI